MQQIMYLGTGFSTWRPWFNLRAVHVGFVVYEVARSKFLKKKRKFPSYFGFALPVIIKLIPLTCVIALTKCRLS